MGRKRKISSEAAVVQHRGQGFSPPIPTIIFEPPPVIIQTTEKLFKDHVQLFTGSPKTQATAAIRLGCDPPPRRPSYGHRPNPSCSPQSAGVISDPSPVAAIVPFEPLADGHDPHASSNGPLVPFEPNEEHLIAAAGLNFQEYSSYEEDHHLAVAMQFATLNSSLSGDYATTSAGGFSTNFDGGISMAYAGAPSPSSTSSINHMLNSYLMSDGDLQNIVDSSSFVHASSTAVNVVPYQHNEEFLLAVGGQNVPPDPSLLAIVPFQNNEEVLLPAEGQNSQEYYYSCVPPIPSLPTAVPFQHNEEGHLATGAPMVSARTFSTPASSSVCDMHTAPALKPSSPTKLVNSNSSANIVNTFLKADNDWNWIFDHIR